MPGSHPSDTTGSVAEHRDTKENREWVLRGVAGAVVVSLLLIAWHIRYDGIASWLLIPLAIGGIIAALRIDGVSNAIDSIESWLHAETAKAAAKQGRFARFVQRPFFAVGRGVWRWTAPLPDFHLRAGIRITALIFVIGATILALATTIYVVIAVVVVLAVLAFFLWLLWFWLSGGSSGSKTLVTRYTTDWIGRPKQEHFDDSGNKVGESRTTSDWLGRTKTVHTDMEGDVMGESRPGTDWLGNPKTIHTDTDGNVTGESRPDADWLGRPKTVHMDAEGEVVGESRVETDILGRQQTVRYDKD